MCPSCLPKSLAIHPRNSRLRVALLRFRHEIDARPESSACSRYVVYHWPVFRTELLLRVYISVLRLRFELRVNANFDAVFQGTTAVLNTCVTEDRFDIRTLLAYVGEVVAHRFTAVKTGDVVSNDDATTC